VNSFESKLRVYKAKRSKEFPAFLIVWCQHEDCPGTAGNRPFLVAEKEWMKPDFLSSNKTGRRYAVVGRACPYCFRTGRLPKRTEIV
jgi:hypothetical protein